MPIYLYRCQACDSYTEVLQKMGASAPEHCPQCNAPALKKVLAPVGIIFKGSGFHKNDYSSKSSGSSNSSSHSHKSSSHDTATESKPSTEKKEAAPAAAKTGDSGPSSKVA